MVGVMFIGKAARALTMFRTPLAWAFILTVALYGGATDKASALPSFARQTGQTCSTCHTAFPQLTPYGRRFKLNGYVAEGGDYPAEKTEYPPIAFMLQSTYTHYNGNLDPASAGLPYSVPSPNGGFTGRNNFIDGDEQFSVFWGGKIYGNVGAFIQTTYSNDYARVFGADNSDVRVTNSFNIGTFGVLYGLTVNNNPTVQDVWNTTPAWSSPFIDSNFSLDPVAGTMIENFAPGQQLGAGGYVFLDDTYYAELSVYGSLSQHLQTTLGACCGAFQISGDAPYYRLAIEKTYGDHNLMIGAYGMEANIIPTGQIGFGTDKITDTAFDSQYQWIHEDHAVTLRGNFIFERQILDNTFAYTTLNGPPASNPTDYLRKLQLGAEYVYAHTYAFTATWFQITGSPDAYAYQSNVNNSPNSSGWLFDVSFLPFSKGGPDIWPWLNTRVGVSYTAYTRFDGSTNNIDGEIGRSASDNNLLMVYAFTMF